jgi:hypothetical protein
MFRRIRDWFARRTAPRPAREYDVPMTGRVECWQAHPEMPLEAMIDLIQRSPPCYWSAPDWHNWPVTIEAHREAMRRYAASLPPYPEGEFDGRGIVICAGGWRFFASLYVTVRMIRACGCELPVEVWYLGDSGEYDPRMGLILKGVTWRDANAVARERGLRPRFLGGGQGYPPWELKPFAVLFSGFRQVLSLDADSYPVRRTRRGSPDCIARLFSSKAFRDRDLFWPDRCGPLRAEGWRRFGLPPQTGREAIESGQFLVDKRRCWKALNVAWWLNEHRDYTYKLESVAGVYGDKDLFDIAWTYTQTPWQFPWPRPAFWDNAYIQKDFDGDVLFVHRTHSKFRFNETDRFQSYAGGPVAPYGLRLKEHCREDEAHAYYREAERLVYPERFFRVRGSRDRDEWDDAWLRGVPGLPDRLDGLTVLDLDAGVGAFAALCLERGAAHVTAVQDDPALIPHFQRNVARWAREGRLTPVYVRNEAPPEADVIRRPNQPLIIRPKEN